jgi:hypothetical protein
VFADAKEKHGMRYTLTRGLKKQSLKALLTFACMNLKKLANWKQKNGFLPPQIYQIRFWLIIFVKLKSRCWNLCVPTPALSTA